MSWAIALDVGGTFTDVTLLDTRSGRLTIAKTPFTPADPSQGLPTGVRKALALGAASPDDLEQVLHGTTIATNAILEGKGVPTGLLTTARFRYVLEIGRHDIPRHANMFAWQKPPRPVPPELIPLQRRDRGGLRGPAVCRRARRDLLRGAEEPSSADRTTGRP